jgi:two-component system OmpR family response regulator
VPRRRHVLSSISMRLLIIEDEADLLRRLAKILRAEGYAVDTAADGEEGLHKAQENEYDTILLDAMLPVFDGWELLARLRKTKTTPVLMLTARDSSADRVRGLDGGADDYVVKPFDLPELLARLRALVRRGSAQASARIDLGEVVIDTAQRCVWRKGKVVSLLPSEYALLEYLSIHRGEVATRTALYEHLFDENETTLSNLLDVRVSNLRRKLGQDFIITRRGHGYGIGIEP